MAFLHLALDYSSEVWHVHANFEHNVL